MSEKLTDSRRAALRERGIFPRSYDLNILFGSLGAVIGYQLIEFNIGQKFDLNQILLLSLIIPFSAAMGSIMATLIQSRFLIRFSFSREKKELSFTNFFYALIKLIVCLVIGAILFRKILVDAAEGSLSLKPALESTASIFLSVLVLFGLVGLLISRFVFLERYRMSRSEMEADAREGEMRPEVKAALDTNIADSRE